MFVLIIIMCDLTINIIAQNTQISTNTKRAYLRIRGEKKSKINSLYIKIAIKNKEYHLKQILFLWIALLVVFFILLKNLVIAFFVSVILCSCYLVYKKIKHQIKNKEALIFQFREALISISNSLKSGANLSTSIERCKNELTHTLKEQVEKPMLKELEIMVNELNLGNSASWVLNNFKERVKIEEVENFVNAAIITEKTGGNLAEVMENVCIMIGDRIQMKREIESLTAGKRNESRVLTIVPLIMIPLLAILSPSYLRPMYETFFGKVLMAIGVILLVANLIIGKKIMDIEL